MIGQSFNSGWELDPNGNSLGARLSLGGNNRTRVQLPHDAMIYEKTSPEEVSGAQTGFYPGGEYTYYKNFDVPSEWEGKRVILAFGGVYQTAMVFVNGDFAGSNLYGYGAFDIVIDPFLNFGTTNEVKVIANNPMSNSRWYSGSGIYRGVQLFAGGEIHIPKDGVRVTTKSAEREMAVVEIETKIQNMSRTGHVLTLRTRICESGAEAAAAEDTVTLTLFGGDEETIRQNITVEAPKLWDCDNPYLYDVCVDVLEGDELLDSSVIRTGIRTLSLDAKRGLRLNGKAVKQRGTCIHHDNGIIGAATFAAAEEKRAREIKEAGFNAIRSAHHPMSTEMLNACDKYGLLVMDELSDMWYEQKNRNDFSTLFDTCWEEEVRRMVVKDYNHPCVILYSSGNEILDLGRKGGGRVNRRICNRFHELDSTRYTTTGVNGLLASLVNGSLFGILGDILQKRGIDPQVLMAGGSQSGDSDGGVGAANMIMSITNDDEFCAHPLMTRALEEAAQAADITGFNYLTGRHVLEKDIHPNKTVVGTETYPADIVRLWRIVEENVHVLGDYTWTGYDYLGEAGCGIFYYDGTVNFSSHFPDRAAYIGDINLIGYRRPISYLREIVYGLRKDPYIGVIRLNRYGQAHSQTAWIYKDNVSSWTWPGYEGKPTEVDIYSPDEEVELFLNGRSLGKKACGRDHGFTATYAVTYEAGELIAVGYRNGQETGRYVLKTAAEEVSMEVAADKTVLKAGGEDLAFLTVRLKDEAGVENIFAKKLITVSVDGAGVLQGYGSAEPQPLRSYQDTTWETFDGEVMAVIRSTEEAGKINVRFSAEGCEDAVVEIESRA